MAIVDPHPGKIKPDQAQAAGTPLPGRLLAEAMLLGVSDEVFLLDATTLQILEASHSVYSNLGCDLTGLRELSLDALLGVSQQTLKAHIAQHRHQSQFVELMQDQAPLAGIISNDQLRVLHLQSADEEKPQELVLVVKNDFASKEDALQALRDSESRFQAIVSNTPGLVFQFQLDRDGEIAFVYLSDGCKALLGLSSQELKSDPKLFYAMINARDRTSLRRRLERSTVELRLLNWEGRVWIDDWQDTKWINLRSIPRVLSNGVVQWEGIMTNITQSKKEKHEIEQSRRSLIELSAHMDQIKEQERSRIAREIHDDLGGNLTAIKIGLASIINRIVNDQKVSLEQAHNLESIVDNTFEAVHRISSDLRPNILDLGIVAALEWQAKEFEKQIAIACDFTSSQSEISVSSAQAITLFRICQESMSNIAKHAQARRASVQLVTTASEIVMTIRDDGVGISSGDVLKTNSFGLRGMQERVAALNGSLTIGKAADMSGRAGTQLTIRLPVQA